MAQIKAKQVKLVAEGDLIIGDSNANGSILSIGAASQVVISNGTTGAWGYLGDLRDLTGTIVVNTTTTPSQVNNVVVSGGATGTGPTFTATGSDTNIDINLTIKGTGEVLVPVSYAVVSANALTTKQYVDGVATGLDFKNSVRAATVAASDLTGFVYTAASDDETAGAAPWTSVTAPVFDGITLVDGDRVLIKDSTDAKGNGVFTYDSGASTFVRAEDADNSPDNEVSGGLFTFVEEGATQADTGWVASSPDGIAVLGTDDLIFVQFSAAGMIEAGIGLTQVGTDFDVNVDDITTTIDGSDNVVVGHTDSTDHSNQVLIGQDATGGQATALWDYLEDLRASGTGELIIDGVGVGSAVNHLKVTNSIIGNPVLVESVGADTNINLEVTAKGTGRLKLDGTLWPDAGVTGRSILAVQDGANDDLVVVTSTDGSGNMVLCYNDTTNTIEWQSVNIVGSAFTLISGDSGPTATADITGDSLSISGGDGIATVSANDPESITIDMDIDGLTLLTDIAATDTIVIFDISTGTHKKATISEILTDQGPSFSTIVGDSGSSIADTAQDTLTIAGGEAIVTTATDDPEILTIDLDIVGLVNITPAVDPGDIIVIYDVSTATHVKVTVNQFFDDLDVGVVKYDDASATGGANEVFAAFFSFTPLVDAAVTVFFNGIALRDTGWTRSGTTLTMVDAVNGYSTETGDIISARYETAP